jgi:Acyclic terpene utilisation family protein AtuA
MLSFASNYPSDPVDVIIGDWMSEANMTSRGGSKFDAVGEAYEPTFLEALIPALPYIAKYNIKVAVNAGASDTEKLFVKVEKLLEERNLGLKVAWISGDEVLPAVRRARKKGESDFENVYTGEKLADWQFDPIYAQAYLGESAALHTNDV